MSRVLIMSTPPGFTSKWLAPRLTIDSQTPIRIPENLRPLPLILDDNREGIPDGVNWLEAAGLAHVDVNRVRFSAPKYVLDAVIEGAGIRLAHDVLAFDEPASDMCSTGASIWQIA
jgi:LysR family transcriptional regulator, glycine cleavage system transcriptional activator